jgi:multisubunit Na+/H+ antiporter MnhC subunit
MHRIVETRSRWRSHMKPLALLGIVLMVLGLGALAYQGVTYTTRETVVDVGPIHATAERQKTIPLPPVLGITAVVAGVALLMVGRR